MGHQRLEGGTGIVKLLGGSVGKGPQRVIPGLVKEGGVAVDLGQIVGGIGGHRQDLPCLDALHHHRAAPGILRLQSLDGVGQNLLHLLLEAEVQSEQNVVPRLGVCSSPVSGSMRQYSLTTFPLVDSSWI